MTLSRLTCALILAGLLTACGQRGPLYLPDDPAASGAGPGAATAPAAEGQEEPEDELERELEDEDKVHAGSFEDEQ